MQTRRGTNRITLVLMALLLAIAASCGSDDDSTSDQRDPNGTEAPADDAGTPDQGGGGGTSTLVIDGVTYETDGGRCHLEPQDSAGGGGQILATAMATFENDEGDQMLLDFTRFDADSMFHGDDISLAVGDFADGLSYRTSLDEGTVSVEGSVVSAADVELTEVEADPITISFDIAC